MHPFRAEWPDTKGEKFKNGLIFFFMTGPKGHTVKKKDFLAIITWGINHIMGKKNYGAIWKMLLFFLMGLEYPVFKN